MEQNLENLKQKYELQYRLADLEKLLMEKKEEANYALYEKREADARLREYGGSLKSLLGRFSGKQPEEKEQLARNARDAAQWLERANREIAVLEQQVQEAASALGQLPEIVSADDPEWKREAARIEAVYLLKTALPLPDEAIEALENTREWTQPKLRWGPTWKSIVKPRYEYQQDANNLAKTIRCNVERINECLALLDRPAVELGPYFYGPEAYLVTAFQYGTLDQMNKALEQMRDCRRALADLKIKLE